MPIIPKIFPQSRIIAPTYAAPPVPNHEHLGQNMITFREITTFFSKTMIAFRRKPHIYPSIPTKTRKKPPQIPPSSPLTCGPKNLLGTALPQFPRAADSVVHPFPHTLSLRFEAYGLGR